MADDAVSIEFAITGPGWADLKFHIGSREYVADGVSYTTDVLGDLLRAALMIATGGCTARASFDGEPMETRLIIGNDWDRSEWRKRFRVRVFTARDIYEKTPDEACDLVFEAECDERAFLSAVATAATDILNRYGTDGYPWWDMPFPMRALRALETALVTEEPAPKQQPPGDIITIFKSEDD